MFTAAACWYYVASNIGKSSSNSSYCQCHFVLPWHQICDDA